MPLPPIREPDAEPLDRTVKVRLSARQVEHLDLAVKEFRMSRSWVLRESLALGFPLFVEKVRQRRRAGLVPRGEYQNPNAAGPLRGPRSDGPRSDRWVHAPGARAPRASRGRGSWVERQGRPRLGSVDGQDWTGKAGSGTECCTTSVPDGLSGAGSGRLVPSEREFFGGGRFALSRRGSLDAGWLGARLCCCYSAGTCRVVSFWSLGSRVLSAYHSLVTCSVGL